MDSAPPKKSKHPLLDELFEIEFYRSGRFPTLKMIYDNLRCYPILAFFFAGAGIMSRSPDTITLIVLWCTGPLFLWLLFVTVSQTALLLSVLVAGAIVGIARPDADQTPAWFGHNWFRWLVIGLGIGTLFSTYIAAIVILRAITLLVPAT